MTNSTDTTVSVISTATDNIINTITVGLNPSAIAIKPDGLHAYVNNSASNDVSAIDLSTDLVTQTMTSPDFSTPIGIAIM